MNPQRKTRIITRVLLLLIAICVIVILISLSHGQTGDACNRLDPCCYGEGKPPYIYHASQSYRYWEMVNRETNNSIFQIWHYWNDTWLFFDSTTKHTTTGLSHQSLHYYVMNDSDFSKEGRCWLDRMVKYIE